MPTAPHVKTDFFEGPLDLLLELIEKRKLLINDISLASVTDEYIARVNGMGELPVGETADFVALAATLLLIKSRSLLPFLSLTEEESRDIKELEYRLALYQLIKEASKTLSRRADAQYLYEGRTPELPPLYIPDATATVENIRAAANTLMQAFPQTLALPKVEVRKIVSLEEMIQNLADRVTKAFKLSFHSFAGLKDKEDALREKKPEIIVGFLALLELVKQGIIKATQSTQHGDITLEQASVSTPSYD